MRDSTPIAEMHNDPWETRASRCGSDPAGVLFGRLPPAINEQLHAWHCRIVREHFLARMPAGGTVLDLASGYGRLAVEFRTARPDLFVIGLDRAPSYCRAFLHNTGCTAVCADIGAVPFVEGAFDGILAVTALMYVPPAERVWTVASWLRLLKPGGRLLLIDPGEEYMRLARFAGASRSDTSGRGCTLGELRQIRRTVAAGVTAEGGGMRGLALLLPFILACRRWSRPCSWLLAVSQALDASDTEVWPRWALHRWWLIERLRD